MCAGDTKQEKLLNLNYFLFLFFDSFPVEVNRRYHFRKFSYTLRAVVRKNMDWGKYPWLNSPPSCLGSSLNNVKTSLNFGSIIKKNWNHVMSMMRASTYRFLWKKLLFKRCILIALIPHPDLTRLEKRRQNTWKRGSFLWEAAVWLAWIFA